MKKLFMILLVLAFVVSMAACGTKEQRREVNTSVDNRESFETEVTESLEIEAAGNGTVDSASEEESSVPDDAGEMESTTDMKINVQIGNTAFTATLENTVAAREFAEMMRSAPISINMSDYSGFEKVGSLGRSLTSDNRQTATSAGDIVLYSGNQIVLFYGSNSWSYTRIGKIDDLSGWEEALGSEDVTAVFTLME